MRHLFSADGEAALVVTMARRPLLAFDFDGTLAPIVARPDDARVPPAVERRLERLSRVLPLAIVSGRRVDDVRARLSFTPRYIVGNHGRRIHGCPKQTRCRCLTACATVSRRKRNHCMRQASRWKTSASRLPALSPLQPAGAGPRNGFPACRDPAGGVRAFGGKLVMNIVVEEPRTRPRQWRASSNVEVGPRSSGRRRQRRAGVRARHPMADGQGGRDDPASLAMYYLDDLDEVAA